MIFLIEFFNYTLNKVNIMKALQENTSSDLEPALNEIEQKATLGSQAIAWRNLPLQTGDSYAPYFEEYHMLFQKLIDHGNAVHEPKAAFMKAGKATQTAEKENHALVNKLPNLERRKNQVIGELESLHPSYKTKMWYRALIVVGVIAVCLSDALYNLPTFESWGMSYLGALVMAVVFGAALVFFAHVFPRIVSLGKTLWQRRLIAFGLLAGFFVIFLFFGQMRADYLAKIASENGSTAHYSALPFALLSEFLLVIAIAIPHFFSATKEELEIKSRHEKLTKDKKDLVNEIADIDNKRKTNEANKDRVHLESGSQLNTGYSDEQKVISHAMMTFSSFKKTNLLHREDRVKPNSFNEPYPFIFKTYHNFDSHHNSNILPS